MKIATSITPFPFSLKPMVERVNFGVDETKIIPEVPPVNEGTDRLVHTTGAMAEPIFEKGLPIGLGINCHTRTYGTHQIPLVNSNNKASFCNDIGYFRQAGTYSSGVAIVIDMPESIHRHFRISGTDLIPREFIRGAVERNGNWIPNPHYDSSYVYEEKRELEPAPVITCAASMLMANMVPRPSENGSFSGADVF